MPNSLGVLRHHPRSARCFPDRDWVSSGRWSGCCDRPRPASSPAREPCGRSRAGPRRPAARSPRGPDGGRYRAGRCRHRLRAPDGRSRSCRTAWSGFLSDMMSGLEQGFESENAVARRQAARRASSRESGRRQPAEEAPGQTTAIVENDARRDYLAISKHSNPIAHEVSKRDMRLRRPPDHLLSDDRVTRATKKRGREPALFVRTMAARNYSPTAAARSVFFSTMRADLPRRLRR